MRASGVPAATAAGMTPRRRDVLRAAGTATVTLAAGGRPRGALGDVAAGGRARLKIGIIGAGQIGGTLAEHWVKAGHEVMLSSRHPENLTALAARLGPLARVGTPREAAVFGRGLTARELRRGLGLER